MTPRSLSKVNQSGSRPKHSDTYPTRGQSTSRPPTPIRGRTGGLVLLPDQSSANETGRVLKYGRHAGLPLSKASTVHLQWALAFDVGDHELRQAIADELRGRR